MRHDVRLLLATICLGVAACGQHMPSVPPQQGSNVADKPGQSKEDAAQIWTQLGQHYLELGKLELAKDDLLKALKFNPKSIDAHTVLATLYDRVGDHASAEQHYREAAELAPKSGSTNNNYGMYLCKLGKFDLAQKHFDIAAADGFYQERDIVYANAGTCILLAKGSMETAEADFRSAVEINPKNGQALYQLARVLYQKNDFFKARAFIQRFDALGKSSPDALLLAMNIEVKLGHKDAAHDYAQRLRDQFPDSEQTRQLGAATPSS